MEQYEFKRVGPDTLHDVVFLVKKVARRRRSVAYYRKKYDTPWAAEGQYLGWLAYEKNSGRVVSVSAALPLRAVLPDGREVPMTQMIETFTLPTHRGRGLMTYLTQRILTEQEQNGTRLFFGLLNQNNVHGFVKKLGFTKTLTMTWFRFPIRTFPLEAICRRLGVPGVFRWWARRVLRPFLAPEGLVLPNSVLAEGFGGVLHDARFFAYKSFTFNRLCRFDGIDSWLKFESGLLVGDVVLPTDCSAAQFEAWLRTLQSIARRVGLRQVVFQANPDSQIGLRLAACAQGADSWSVCCRAGEPSMQPFLAQMRFGYGDFETF
jgi:GNAT superfamily N-acetyltransferase